MDYTLNEINMHKNNISNLSNKLLNTFNIDEEILLNNEIKKETEILISLLNLKKNSMMNAPFQNNNINFINPMINPNNIMQNIFMQQQMMNQLLNIQKQKEKFDLQVIFQKNSLSIVVSCNFNEKMQNVIERYRNKSGDRDMEEIFYFDAKQINPSKTVEETKLNDLSKIYVS